MHHFSNFLGFFSSLLCSLLLFFWTSEGLNWKLDNCIWKWNAKSGAYGDLRQICSLITDLSMLDPGLSLVPLSSEVRRSYGTAAPGGTVGWDLALPFFPLTAHFLTGFTFPYGKFTLCPVKILHWGIFSLTFCNSLALTAVSVYFFHLLLIRALIQHLVRGWKERVPHFGFKHLCSW